ncbi:acyltransferase [bacterium]|nr:acyltransferase [bacterium]
MLRVGYYQFRPAFGQKKKNLLRVINTLHAVTADLIVLPELPFTGYYFQDRQETMLLSEEPSGSTIVEALTALCKERNCYVVTGFAERALDKCFNSALLIGPEGLLHTYRKLHLFSEEKNWFDPGDNALQVQTVRGAKIGMMVCFDWIFPEVMRTLALQGAQVICHPSNLVMNYCQDAMRTRCIENMVYAVTANRFGSDKRPHGELKFTGQSQITAPKGVVIHKALPQRETLFITEIDPDTALNKKITALNDLHKDRRPDFYTL